MTIVLYVNDTTTTDIYTLSLHDALPIARRERSWTTSATEPGGGGWSSIPASSRPSRRPDGGTSSASDPPGSGSDRKSTRLNSSHANISYAVFCLKKKTNTPISSYTSSSL